MNVDRQSWRHIASVLLLSFVVAGCASSPTAASPDLLQRIEAARTRGDHEALAVHYDQEAAKARARVVEHRKMAKSYQGLAAAKWPDYTMPAHCESIVRSQEGMATAYEAMASGHRQMAKQAQP